MLQVVQICIQGSGDFSSTADETLDPSALALARQSSVLEMAMTCTEHGYDM